MMGVKRIDSRFGLIPVLEVFDLPAPYQPFNPEIQGQLSGDAFTNSSTRQEPEAAIGDCRSEAVERRASVSIPVIRTD